MLKKLSDIIAPFFAPDDYAERRAEQAAQTVKDIEEMDGIIAGTIPEPVVPSEEPADDPAPEVQVEPDGVSDEVVATATPEPEPAPDAPAADDNKPAGVSDEALSDQEFADFINAMARDAMLAGRSGPQAPAPAAQGTPAEPAQPAVQQVEPRPQRRPIEIPVDLVAIEEMQEAFSDPAKMIQLMGQVYLRARSDAAQDALVHLPSVLRPLMNQEAEIRETAQLLYKENPELNNYRDFVAFMAKKVEDAHPDWKPSKIMSETVAEVKKRLPMLKEARARQMRDPAKPSFVGGGGQKVVNKPSQAKVSALQRDIDSMPDRF